MQRDYWAALNIAPIALRVRFTATQTATAILMHLASGDKLRFERLDDQAKA
jgi:hypothetical protein